MTNSDYNLKTKHGMRAQHKAIQFETNLHGKHTFSLKHIVNTV